MSAVDIAITEPDLADAVAHLHGACGITSYPVASHWFDCIADAQWEAGHSSERIALLMDYINHLEAAA